MNLANRIYDLESVQKQLSAVLLESSSSGFPTLVWRNEKAELIAEIDWNNILSCASILLQSDKFEHLDSALRVAQHCLSCDHSNEKQKLAAIAILEGLTNKQAIKLAIQRGLIGNEVLDELPLPIKMDNVSRDVSHSILRQDGDLIFLNKFQKIAYESSKSNDIISISAPTSAGKSFILERIILDSISTDEAKHIVYIVPTRALISQVEYQLDEMLVSNGIEDVYLSSVPQEVDNEYKDLSKILVFTQERLHWFRTSNPKFRIDLLIIDEAHKIEDGSRGILLQQKIEDLTNDFPEMRVHFSSPFTSNPEYLLRDFPANKTRSAVKTEFVSVNQNLIYVSQRKNKPKIWDVDLCLKDKTVGLGEINLPNSPDRESKKLVFIAAELSDKSGGNLVYCNGAADAEKAAAILYDCLTDEYKSQSSEIDELIALIKKAVHPKYSLIKVLKRKIAFHYGNMPLLIRQEIERLFAKGEIHFIICTSTLLEGVNLPAKSIFIRKPTRGKNNPMSEADFWNLAGRAGRWGKEFQGNVVCVEPKSWQNPPNPDRNKLEIKKATDRIQGRKQDLLKFVNDGTPRAVALTNPDLEYAFSYYYVRFIKGLKFEDNSLLNELQQLLPEIKESVEIPDEIVIKNPGISPIAMQNLLEYFRSYEGELEDLIPAPPESNNAAAGSYMRIVETINEYLSGDIPGRSFYQATLVVNWMLGYPLPRLITSSYNYWQGKKPREYSQVIRDVMKDVEEYARFKFPKHVTCYLDILEFHFTSIGEDKLLSNFPNLNMWLEFGVSQQTQISLISLGMSRNTAITLSEFIANDDLDKKGCILWLKQNNIESFDMPSIIKAEINRVKRNN